MKAFYIPIFLLSLILVTAATTGASVRNNTGHWIDELNVVAELADKENWDDAQERLLMIRSDWLQQTATYHIIMEHKDLDEAEQFFSGAVAACRTKDRGLFGIYLEQLITQLEFLAETQKASWQNIL